MMSDQLPPADRLAAVRASMKALEEEEAGLRSLLLSDPSARTGNHWLVEVREVTSNRTDLKALREMYPAIADEHTYPMTTKRLELRGLTEDGEIVPARQMRKEPA